MSICRYCPTRIEKGQTCGSPDCNAKWLAECAAVAARHAASKPRPWREAHAERMKTLTPNA